MADTPIILADNQDITRIGFKTLAEMSLSHHRISEVSCKKGLIGELLSLNEAVVVADYTNFDFNGMDDLLILQSRFPNVRWILFSMNLSEQFIRRICVEPNFSILFKEATSDEIISALKYACQRKQYLPSQVKTLISTPQNKNDVENVLTPTEIDILKLIAQGKSVKETARIRCSSIHTITTHKKNIFSKLGVNNVYEATKYALRSGLVELLEYYI